MRIVHLITSLHPHGAQLMLYKLLSAMDRERFDPVVISLKGRDLVADKIAALGVPVYCIGMKSGRLSPARLWRLWRVIQRIKPDLIQGWMYHGNLAAQAVSALTIRKTPVLWNIRGSHYILREEKPVTAITVWLGARLSRFPARIINNSRASALNHEQKLSYRADKRVIIPNGFETARLVPSTAARVAVRAELGLAEDALLVGLIGRYHPVKDHANFLQAATLLPAKYSHVHFLLAGEGIDESNEELLGQLKAAGLQSRVHLLGKRNDIARITAVLDIATSSSSAEGFPNVIGEAMSCGVPCVVTNVGDSAWLVGDAGRVVPPRDFVALAEAWRELIDMTAGERQALGRSARRRIEENFSLEAIARQYEALYEQVVSFAKDEAKTKCAVSLDTSI